MYRPSRPLKRAAVPVKKLAPLLPAFTLPNNVKRRSIVKRAQWTAR